MSINIGDGSSYHNITANTSKTSKLETDLSNTLKNGLKDATDEEMMEACKSFESYLVSQVVKQVKSAVAPSQEDENQYISYFGDMIYDKYAESLTESGTLGIAQQLYESMKRNQ